MAATNSSGSGGLGFTGGYMPSFAAAKKPALHQGSSHPTTPQEQARFAHTVHYLYRVVQLNFTPEIEVS